MEGAKLHGLVENREATGRRDRAIEAIVRRWSCEVLALPTFGSGSEEIRT
jgi:hypothetical protein